MAVISFMVQAPDRPDNLRIILRSSLNYLMIILQSSHIHLMIILQKSLYNNLMIIHNHLIVMF